MSEKLPEFESAPMETEKERQQREGLEMFEDRRPITVVQESPEKCAEKIRELEELYSAFERTHDLTALHAITSITLEEVKVHPVREPAHIDIAPIVALLNYLEKQENVPRDVFQRLLSHYRSLDRALGTFTENSLDHTRPEG